MEIEVGISVQTRSRHERFFRYLQFIKGGRKSKPGVEAVFTAHSRIVTRKRSSFMACKQGQAVTVFRITKIFAAQCVGCVLIARVRVLGAVTTYPIIA